VFSNNESNEVLEAIWKSENQKPSLEEEEKFLERLKRAKNKEAIFASIVDKIQKNDITYLMKCLCLAEILLRKNFEGFKQYLKGRIRVFNQLKDSFNIKVIEVTNSILKYFENTPTLPTQEGNKEVPQKKNTFSFIKKNSENVKNPNLIDFTEENTNDRKVLNTMNFQNNLTTQKPDNTQKEDNKQKGFSFINKNQNNSSTQINSVYKGLDLDKLYAENKENITKHNIVPNYHTINYHQNYHISVTDLANNRTDKH